MSEDPVELDSRRGMASQKATDIRRTLAEAESNIRALRDSEQVVEVQILATPAANWSEAAGKARYILNRYAASLAPHDSRHRDLVASVLDDFSRLEENEN